MHSAWIRTLSTGVGALLVFGCGGPAAPSSTTVTCQTLTLTLVLQPTVQCRFLASGTDQTTAAQWASSSPSVTVSSTGLITGVSVGTSTISASARGLSASVDVSVSVPAPPVANVVVSSAATQIVDVTSTIFNGNASSPSPVVFSPPYAFRMSFGDGGPDAVASFGGATFVHTYHDVGTFTGTLTVTSPFGEVSTATASAVVIDLNGTWSTDDLQISCPTPSSGVRSLALTQSGTSLGGSYSGPSGLRPIAGALTGRFVTLTSDDGITFTSDTPNSGVSPDGKSIGLFSNEPCLKGAPMLVFKRQ